MMKYLSSWHDHPFPDRGRLILLEASPGQYIRRGTRLAALRWPRYDT